MSPWDLPLRTLSERRCFPRVFGAQLEKLRLDQPEVVENCSATAGLSLGECPPNAKSVESVLGLELMEIATQREGCSVKDPQMAGTRLVLQPWRRLPLDCPIVSLKRNTGFGKHRRSKGAAS